MKGGGRRGSDSKSHGWKGWEGASKTTGGRKNSGLKTKASWGENWQKAKSWEEEKRQEKAPSGKEL